MLAGGQEYHFLLLEIYKTYIEHPFTRINNNNDIQPIKIEIIRIKLLILFKI
jgi:hypothetical protein